MRLILLVAAIIGMLAAVHADNSVLMQLKSCVEGCDPSADACVSYGQTLTIISASAIFTPKQENDVANCLWACADDFGKLMNIELASNVETAGCDETADSGAVRSAVVVTGWDMIDADVVMVE